MKAIQTDSDIKIKTLAAQFSISENALGNYLNGRRAVPYDVLILGFRTLERSEQSLLLRILGVIPDANY